jgi:hypothetical protein
MKEILNKIPVPLSFLASSFDIRMLANLLLQYTRSPQYDFTKFKSSISNFAALCNTDATITIRLGDDFFNSPGI